jgi:hypothetical protein
MEAQGRSASFCCDAFHRSSERGEIQLAQMPHDAAPHAAQMWGIGVEQRLEPDLCQFSDLAAPIPRRKRPSLKIYRS